MSVSINEISTEFTAGTAAGGGQESGAATPPPEVKVEELRAIVRELLIEELERYLRLAVER